MQAGFEFMRLLTQAHLDLRTAASSAAPTWRMRTGTCAFLRGRA